MHNHPDEPANEPYRLLVADDDPLVLEVFREIFRLFEEKQRTRTSELEARLFGDRDDSASFRCEVASFGQGADAVEAVRRAIAEEKPFAMAFLDVRMPPGQDGVTTAMAIRQLDPLINIVMVTAYTDIPPEDITVLVPPADKILYLQKPCHAAETRQMALALCRKWTYERELLTTQDRLEAGIRERTSDLQSAVTELSREVEARRKAQDEVSSHQKQLVQAQKLAALGTLISGLAHEVSNPNNVALLNAKTLKGILPGLLDGLGELAERDPDREFGSRTADELAEELPRLLDGIERSAERIARMVQDLKGFARKDSAAPTDDVDLNRVVNNAVELLQSTIKKSTHNLSLHLTDGLPRVRGNAQQLEQVVVNLLTNACHALPSPDRAIALTTCLAKEADWICLEVRDEGVGIDKQHLAQITDPFFTTKRDDGGTGLGLAVSLGIVERHQGKLHFASKPPQGTVVTLSLPVSEASATSEKELTQ